MNHTIDTPILTIDTDWAPDFIIHKIIDILEQKKVKATWFITHEDSFLKRLKENPLFEVGIHPNFFPDSTQGTDEDMILSNLKKLVPNATTVRFHALYQSNAFLCKLQYYGLQNDLSLILPNSKNIEPHFSYHHNLFRFPYFWEDDFQMVEDSSGKIPTIPKLLQTKQEWEFDPLKFSFHGLKIFDFHPVHIILNSNSMKQYNFIKSSLGLHNLNKNNIDQYVNLESGIGTFFNQFVEYLSTQKQYHIDELQKIYFDNANN